MILSGIGIALKRAEKPYTGRKGLIHSSILKKIVLMLKRQITEAPCEALIIGSLEEGYNKNQVKIIENIKKAIDTKKPLKK